MPEDNINLLIKIILYLLLALAFFSEYAFKSKEVLDFIFLAPFLFGIIALIFLYLGYCSDSLIFKMLGYYFASSFILLFGWLIFSILTLGSEGWIITKALDLLDSKAIQYALLLSLFFINLLSLYFLRRNKIKK